ncbi:MAG: hypothetical protein ACRDZ9_06935 [Acidimicrobiales bacterium]
MRRANRVIALLLGLGAVVVGLLALAETALVLLGREAWVIPRGQWDRSLRRLRWESGALVIWLVGAGALGLALVVAQVARLRRAVVPLAVEDPDRSVAIEGRSLAERLADLALTDDDVVTARARVRGDRATVVASVAPGSDHPAVQARLVAALRAAGDRYGLRQPIQPRVSVTPSRSRVR